MAPPDESVPAIPEKGIPVAGKATGKSSGRIFVAILSSRLIGLARDRVIFHLAGFGQASDVINFGLRIANSVQTLLGEQALSAALIPAYSKRLGQGTGETHEEARALAGAAFSRLLVVAGLMGTVGALSAPWIARLALGSDGDPETASYLILALRFMFPMTAMLVLSAWCLSILNSHRRFFLSYVAPALWNLAILGALGLLVVRTSDPTVRELVLALSLGSLIGGILQWGVQFPAAVKVNGGLKLTLRGEVPGLREATRAFWPILMGRGSLQLMTVAEAVFAMRLAPGTQSALASGQRLFFLTIMVCSMIQAIVYLPEFSRTANREELGNHFREALSGVWFLVVPSTVGLILFGYPIVGAVFRGGRFGVAETALCYLVLATYVLGLWATASSRIVQSVLYSQGDTKAPAAYAVLRSAVALGIALATMHWFASRSIAGVASRLSGTDVVSTLGLGAVAFALGSAIAAHLEWFLLHRRAGFRLAGSPRKLAVFSSLALLASVPAGAAWWLVSVALGWTQPALVGAVVLFVFGVSYLGVAHVLRIDEFEQMIGQALRKATVDKTKRT